MWPYGEPAWLVAWCNCDHQQLPSPAPKPPPRKPVDGPYVPLRMRGQAAAIGIIAPKAWPFDGGKRREPVLDEGIPDRVARKVGWHRCMRCRKPF